MSDKILFNIARIKRKRAIAKNTKAGAAIVTTDGRYFGGCNIESVWKTGTIHAEVSAINSMVAYGGLYARRQYRDR